MKRLFLASSFNGVARLFSSFVNEDLKGKTVTFIPTASVPEKLSFYVNSGRKALLKLGLIVDELEVSTATADEISSKLQQNDFIYITGGNTFFLLQELKRTGADSIIIEQINSGKVYIGESAGAIIMSPNIEYAKDMDSCKKAPDLNTFSALKVVEFYPLPHYTNQPFKKAVEKIIAAYESKLQLYPISNSQAILVNGEDVRVESKK
ncbi:MAG: Type 1 glutamine amidotransferase-like domain-containing protein [Oscillospiraceae bacterium]|jgi:dipeptidase E|nr:Type 1 glutamine amidotransferase-like domain-containing protein [Oscillospiraceae bacterium]